VRPYQLTSSISNLQYFLNSRQHLNSTLPAATGRLCALLLLATCLFAQAPAPSSRELVLTVGKSLVVNSAANIERVAVGFGDIAEARAVGPKEVLIDGKAAGETSLIIWQEGGNKLFFDVVVRANSTPMRTKIDTLRRQLEEQLPGQNIHANYENDFVFLTGTAKDLTSVDRANAIAGAVGKVVNLLYVDVPSSETQILLKVQFASVDRSNTTELGLNLISTGATNTVGRATTGQFTPPNVTIPPGAPPTVTLTDALNFFFFRPDLNLGATIKALQTRGLFEILAEPNVLAINGKQASFLAGGEFPYPILQGGGSGLGQVTIAFREFGVRINFLPLVTPRGTIRLGVAPEVSALDFGAGLNFQGTTIPGLTTRRVQTEIELQSGQSFAIGGLLDRRLQDSVDRVPLLASVPLLGKLFQSKSLTKSNNELLVIVTPEIVRPIPEGQPRPALEMPYALPGPDTQPRTPAISSTGPVPDNPATQSMPVEKLLDSIKQQNSIKLEGHEIVGNQGVQTAPQPGAAIPMPTPAPAAPAAPAAAPVKQ
jgi:pilus assembly protein CpaC